MQELRPLDQEERSFFRAALIVKGAYAFLESILGVAIYVVGTDFIFKLLAATTLGELSEDPNDVLGKFFYHLIGTVSPTAKAFIAAYLFFYGVIKLLLVIGILKRRLWVYPAALVAYSVFVVYQLFRFYHTHSLVLFFLTFLDLLIIWFVWREYRTLRPKE